ncbi:MAG: DUF3574 domain-containing protein [Oscillospiraceae bacterium]|nr:DUF3574 domain-containing protein [Oscillospiraceae bacterium]
MTKAWKIAILILCAAALCLSALSLVVACKSGQEQGDVQYVLYLGTNDKDSNQPVFSHEQAKQTLTDILVRRFGGYTVQEANGGWIDGGTEYQEYTLVIHLSDTDLASVHALCDELIKTFNQSSVLIQANRTQTEFYAGPAK